MAFFARLDQLLFSVSVARISTGYARRPRSRLLDHLLSQFLRRVDGNILIASSDVVVCWWATDKLHFGSLGRSHGFTRNDLGRNTATQAGQQHVANRLRIPGLYDWDSIVAGSFGIRNY